MKKCVISEKTATLSHGLPQYSPPLILLSQSDATSCVSIMVQLQDRRSTVMFGPAAAYAICGRFVD